MPSVHKPSPFGRTPISGLFLTAFKATTHHEKLISRWVCFSRLLFAQSFLSSLQNHIFSVCLLLKRFSSDWHFNGGYNAFPFKVNITLRIHCTTNSHLCVYPFRHQKLLHASPCALRGILTHNSRAVIDRHIVREEFTGAGTSGTDQ